MSSAYESADLLLRLYELRREDTLRKARAWFGSFQPASAQDIVDTIRGEHSAYYRMVTTYWEMAAAMVNHGAIDEPMFRDANGEYLVVFAKVEPFLAEYRTLMRAPQYLHQLQQLILRIPDHKERLAAVRERMKQMAAARPN